MDQAIIKKLTEIIHANLHKENFGISGLALAAGMSRSTLHRKLSIYLNKSASQFIREIRLQKAMEMLQHDEATASEISYQVGFNSPTYFNTCFHQYFGFPPGEVKKRNLAETVQNNEKIAEEPDTGKQEPALAGQKQPIRRVLLSRGISLYRSAVVIILAFLFYFVYISYIKEAIYFNDNRLKAHEKSIAVLPFKNLSYNSENNYFADGVMEDILNCLFRIKELRVISRTTAEYYHKKSMATPDIARELGVNFILQGTVQQCKGKVRITVQLIDARLDKHIWSEMYDRELADIFIIQSSIAKQIADELQTVLTSNEIEYIEKIHTKNPEAYSLYLKGRFFWNKRTENGLKKSVEYFEMALVADPDYALAYAGLADAYFILARRGWLPRIEGYAKSKDSVLRALKLDQNLAEAHATMGTLLCWSEWKWMEAQKEFLLANKLNTHYAIAYQYHSELLDIIGNNGEARKQINLALKLDPFSQEMHMLSALYFYHESRFDESLQECEYVEKLDPGSLQIHWRYFHNYFWKGEDLKAVEAIQKILTIDSLTMRNAGIVINVYNKSKINGVLKWLIESELKKPKPEAITVARLNSLLGKKNEAANWLVKAWRTNYPDIPGINNDPDFEILRRNPKFKGIINQMGLSAYINTTTAEKH